MTFTHSPNLKNILLYLILTSLALAMLFPLLWLLSTALKGASEDVFSFPPQLWPRSPTLANFRTVWQSYPLGRYLLNSSLVTGSTVLCNLLLCSLAAYPLARLDFRGRELILALVVSTIMIPFQIVMIPLYILTARLHLHDTYLGVILPGLVSAFGIFLLRQAFLGVPKELEEAARLDGCSEMGIWWCVMVPAIRPALITLGIFVFIGTWGDFLWPLIVLKDPLKYTLPLGVAQLSSTFSLDWRLVAAGSVIAIAPSLLFFVLLQRYIIPSEVSSGIKG